MQAMPMKKGMDSGVYIKYNKEKMKTRIGDIKLVKEAAKLIQKGEVVAFPTETVYGLGADALNANAVAKIFAAKGRPQDNPLIVHLYSKEQLELIAKDIPQEAYKLIDAFTPGPLTLVLKKQRDVPDITTSGLQTVAIRFPKSEVAQKLIYHSHTPIAAPSANLSGRLSPTTAEAVYEDMNGKISMILDGGKSDVGIESTVLDLTKTPYTILRPGAITAEMLAPYLSKVETFKGEIKVAVSPGMKYKHYSPRCDCVGVKSVDRAITHYYEMINDTKKVVIVGNLNFVKQFPKDIKALSLGDNMEECMSSFFDALRKAEKEYNYIILQNFEDYPEYFSLNNRIEKATSYTII